MKPKTDRVVFTVMPSCSASVRPNWSTETLANLLWRISHLVAEGRHIVVTRSGYESAEVRNVAKKPILDRTTLVSVGNDSFWKILSGTSANGEMLGSTLIYAPLGAALLPLGFGDALANGHGSGSSDCIIVKGLPIEATIVLYNSSIAQRALARRLVRDSGFHKVRSTWAEELVETANQDQSKRALTEVDGPMLLGLQKVQVPVSLDLLSADGVRRFERICRGNGDWMPLNSAAFGSAAPHRTLGNDDGSPELLVKWGLELARDLARPWPNSVGLENSEGRVRVLFVSHPVAFSGAEEALCKAIARIPTSRFALYALVGADGEFADRLRALGVTVTIADVPICESSLRTFNWLSNYFVDLAPRVVHFNAFSGEPPVVVAKLLARICIFHLRVSTLRSRQIECLLQMDGVVAVSEYTRRSAIDVGVRARDVVTIYDPIDTEASRPLSHQQRLSAKIDAGLSPYTATILMVARFERRKRHDLLLRAFAQIENVDAQLVLVGESNGDIAYEREIERLILTDNLRDRVVIRGFQHDIRSIESAADVAVLCSENEPLGIFALECMALGVPVIVSENSGAAEIVGNDRRAGLLHQDGNCEHLAESLRWMLMHPSERHEMGLVGRERCIAHCGKGNSGLEHFIDSLLHRAADAQSQLEACQ